MGESLRVAFVFPRSRNLMFGIHQESLPSNAFYGSRELAQLGLDVVEIEPSVQTGLWTSTLSKVQRWISNRTRVGIVASTYLSQLHALNGADVICATSDRPGMAIAFLKMLGLVHRPLVWLTMSLYDTYQNNLNRYGQMLTRALVKQAFALVTFAGQPQQCAISETFEIDAGRVFLVHWGADVDYYSPYPRDDDSEYVFTAGGACRDFPSLFNALRESALTLKLVVPIGLLIDHNIPPNAQLIPGATLLGARQILNDARLVVVATHPNRYCAGQWTVFSAMSMGRPVIWTERQAAEDYEFRHRVNISLVKPGSFEDLKREIQWHLDHPDESVEMGRNARRLMVEKWNMQNYANELLSALKTIPGSRMSR